MGEPNAAPSIDIETARAILARVPLDVSRRASYGQEQRTETVTVHWPDSRRAFLAAARDDRISFALRDRYEAGAPSCRDQLLGLIAQHGAPEALTISWDYQSDWEGEPPRQQRGRLRLSWQDAAALLDLPEAPPAPASAILHPMKTPRVITLEGDTLGRLLRYVRIDTQSSADSPTYPSTPGQLDLLRLLRDELAALGCSDVAMDGFGYVTATLPPTLPPGAPATPVVAFFAHVDTSADAPGKDVQPIVWRDYSGGLLTLPGDPQQQLDPAEIPQLTAHAGHDIVTSNGRTLLGADDKAGVAAVMAAVAYLLAHPEIPHGTIKVAFNPDEEVGRGVDHFDVQAFGADYAYTLDAGEAGEVENETFSADGALVRFFGRSAHPGYAKGKLVNAIKVACDFVASLPRDTLSPETTAGRDGFVHPVTLTGAAEEASVKFIVRDFVTAELAGKEALLRSLAEAAVARHPGARYELTITAQYRNMHDVLMRHPNAMARADEAVRRIGLTPIHRPIRGGTDGSRLCAMGLPTPNLFAGWQMIHSRREWVCVEDMGKAAQVIIELAQLWAEEGATP